MFERICFKQTARNWFVMVQVLIWNNVNNVFTGVMDTEVVEECGGVFVVHSKTEVLSYFLRNLIIFNNY